MAKQVKGTFQVYAWKQGEDETKPVGKEHESYELALIAANAYVLQNMGKGHGYCPNVTIRNSEKIVSVVYTHSPIRVA